MGALVEDLSHILIKFDQILIFDPALVADFHLGIAPLLKMRIGDGVDGVKNELSAQPRKFPLKIRQIGHDIFWPVSSPL